MRKAQRHIPQHDAAAALPELGKAAAALLAAGQLSQAIAIALPSFMTAELSGTVELPASTLEIIDWKSSASLLIPAAAAGLLAFFAASRSWDTMVCSAASADLGSLTPDSLLTDCSASIASLHPGSANMPLEVESEDVESGDGESVVGESVDGSAEGAVVAALVPVVLSGAADVLTGAVVGLGVGLLLPPPHPVSTSAAAAITAADAAGTRLRMGIAQPPGVAEDRSTGTVRNPARNATFQLAATSTGGGSGVCAAPARLDSAGRQIQIAPAEASMTSTDSHETVQLAVARPFADGRAQGTSAQALATAIGTLQRVADRPAPPSADLQVLREVLELTAQGLDQTTCADRTGLDEAEVCSIVADFGGFAALVFKLKAQPERAATRGLLFPIQPDRDTVAKMSPARRRRLGYSTDTHVIVPAGYHRVRDGRTMDLRQACAVTAAAIRQGRVNDAVLLRFHARRHPLRISALTLPDVTVTWQLCCLGRLPDVAAADSTTAHFARVLLSAYELLESARQQALEAVTDLASGRLEAQTARQRCAQAAPLHQAALARLDHQICAAADERQVRLALDRFSQTAAAIHLPATVAEISEGQMLRIAQAAGLTMPSAVQDSRAVRGRIEAAGLGSDIDQLVPLGLTAEAAGHANAFWTAIEARAAGDPHWDAGLRDLT